MPLLLLQKGGPQWFKLQEAESGEIQVQLKVSKPGEPVISVTSIKKQKQNKYSAEHVA